MDKLFDNAQTLTLFLIFFVPGFVSLKVYDSLVPSERRDFSKAIFDAVAYSALNYAFLYPLVAWMRSGRMNLPTYAVAVALVIVVFPCVWPFLWIRALSTRPFSRHFIHPVQRPWDLCLWRSKGLLDDRAFEGPTQNRWPV